VELQPQIHFDDFKKTLFQSVGLEVQHCMSRNNTATLGDKQQAVRLKERFVALLLYRSDPNDKIYRNAVSAQRNLLKRRTSTASGLVPVLIIFSAWIY
jgi:hypothetical protein